MNIQISDINYLGSFYQYVVRLQSALKNSHIPCKVWDEITYPWRGWN